MRVTNSGNLGNEITRPRMEILQLLNASTYISVYTAKRSKFRPSFKESREAYHLAKPIKRFSSVISEIETSDSSTYLRELFLPKGDAFIYPAQYIKRNKRKYHVTNIILRSYMQ